MAALQLCNVALKSDGKRSPSWARWRAADRQNNLNRLLKKHAPEVFLQGKYELLHFVLVNKLTYANGVPAMPY